MSGFLAYVALVGAVALLIPFPSSGRSSSASRSSRYSTLGLTGESVQGRGRPESCQARPRLPRARRGHRPRLEASGER